MATPSVTYSFTNGTVADADEVNTNFTDIINSLTNGNDDLSINALTCAGAATFNGNVTLGNASSDDVTFTGSLSSDLPIKTTNTYDIGSATIGLAGVYFGTADTDTVRIVAAAQAADRTYTMPDAGSAANFLMSEGTQSVNGSTTFNGGLISNDPSSGSSLTCTNDNSGAYIANFTHDGANNGNGILITCDTASVNRRALRVDVDAGECFSVRGDSSILHTGSSTFTETTTTGPIMTIDNPTTGATSSTANLLITFSGEDDANDGRYIKFNDKNSSETGSISANSSTTVAYNTSSDARLKEDVRKITDGLSRLMRIKPSYYKWKRNGIECEGFIAQELLDVVPVAVTGKPTDDVEIAPMGVDYGKLTPVLVAAVQEQQALIEQLQKEVAALRDKA